MYLKSGLDSRGFLLGPWVAANLGISFAPVRKQGKLPAPKHKVTYELEYGSDAFEISQLSMQPGDKVVIFDDLLATGGSAQAAAKLVALCGGKVVGNAFIVELTALNGRAKLEGHTFSIFQYDD
jgi:adenine phosphoribosyltransferase